MLYTERRHDYKEGFRQKQVHLVHFWAKNRYTLKTTEKAHARTPATGQPHTVPVFGWKGARYVHLDLYGGAGSRSPAWKTAVHIFRQARILSTIYCSVRKIVNYII